MENPTLQQTVLENKSGAHRTTSHKNKFRFFFNCVDTISSSPDTESSFCRMTHSAALAYSVFLFAFIFKGHSAMPCWMSEIRFFAEVMKNLCWKSDDLITLII